MTRFNIITSLCRMGGLGQRGYIPWSNSKLYTNMFDELTRGNGKNAVLIGGNTYNYIWSNQYIPFPGRHTLIWSRNLLKDEPNHYQKIEYINNLHKVVTDNRYEEIWIIGGERMFSQIIKENIPIQTIYVNYIDKDYKCDLFFPLEIFNKNDKFNIIGRRVVNSTNQYIMKVDRNET